MATMRFTQPDWWRGQLNLFRRRTRTEIAGISAQRKPDEGQRTWGQAGSDRSSGSYGSGNSGYYPHRYDKSDPYGQHLESRRWEFPGYGDPLPPTYNTYRHLLLDSTVQLARAQLMGPIRSIEWDLEGDEGVAQDRIKFLADMLRPLRNALVREALRALDYGMAPFEVVWDRKQGKWVIVQFKPLLVDITDVVIDRRGNFAGLFQPRTAFGFLQEAPQEDVYLPTNRSMIFTYNGEAGNWYGRPLLENVRVAVSNWLHENTNAGRLSNRATGVFAVIKFPPGTGLDEMGNVVKRINQATAIGEKLIDSAGQGFVCLENYVGMNIKGIVDAASLAKLAEASMWHVDIVDFGNVGSNLDSLLKNKEYLDKLKVRGYLIPERAILESTGGGTKAESEVQGSSGFLNAQLIAGDLIEAVNDELDDVIEFNWGFEARGTIRIKNPLLESKQTEIDKMILDRSFTNPRILDHMWRNYDVPRVWSRRGLPKRPAVLPESEGIMQDEQKKLDHEMALAKTKLPSNGAGGGKPPGSGRGDGTAKRKTQLDDDLYQKTLRLISNRPINGDARIQGDLDPRVATYLLELVTQSKQNGDDDAVLAA